MSGFNIKKLKEVGTTKQSIKEFKKFYKKKPKNKKIKSPKKVDLKGLMNFLNEKADEMRNFPQKWELILYKHLKDLHYKFEFQVPIIVKNQGFILDFILTDYKIFLEADGKWHREAEQIKKDNRRTKLLRSLGYQPIRLTNSQISIFTKEQIDEIIKQRISMLRDVNKL